MNQNNPDNHLRIVTGDGTEIAVTIHDGSGPHMLMIHGIGSSRRDFANVVPALSEFCQPVTLDLRGHGDSSRPNRGYHYDDYVRDLDQVLDSLNLDLPIVLGHSLGGIITLLWASTHADATRAIIIEDSPLRSGESFASFFDGWLSLNALPEEQVRAWYASENPTWSDAILDQRAQDMVNTCRTAIEELRDLSLSGEGLDTAGDLSAISNPLLFMHGDPETGSMVHPEDLVTFRTQVPQTRIARIASAGHNIHRSHADQWVEHVREFVKGLDARQ